ncbi:diacylglycerol kinase family protein [uncultured Methylibium sp.]|uniref:diacylglycerol/lipid kinase family protein n=1 Tax=uncultured Methylibium sp. TaxID=381093 RepID=UPI0025FF5955|nr:diacylglycerol kinase family protein [uncultured Methylibium sp.]
MTPPSSSPLFIVFNLGSGHGDAAETRALIEARCAEAGRTLHLLMVEDPRRIAEIAADAVRRARADEGIVVAAGGDGTINAVAQATLGSGCRFGVLPQGTFNYFSRATGIPADTHEAMQLLLSGRVRPAQVGLVNERVFLVNASLGLYPKLLEDREALKRQWGRSRLVAFWAGLMTVLRAHRNLRVEMEVHGRATEVRTPTLFVANNALQLEQLGLPEASAIEAGQLAAITVRPAGRLAWLGLLLRGALGRLGEAEQVTSIGFRRLTVRSARPFRRRRVKVATDGEIVWLRLPLEFAVSPVSLDLIGPADSEATSDGPAT